MPVGTHQISRNCSGMRLNVRLWRAGLARSGHTATAVGTQVVVVGGHVRGGPPTMDVLVVHLDKLRISRYAGLTAWLCPSRP